MFIRLTACAAAGLALAGCGFADTSSMKPAEARVTATRLLKPCTDAVDRLDTGLVGERAGAYRLATEVEAQCSWATRQLMAAGLPDRIGAPCKDASEAARIVADAAQTAANRGQTGDEVRLEDARGMARNARTACETALDVQT